MIGIILLLIVLKVSFKKDVNWLARPKLLIEKNTSNFNLNTRQVPYKNVIPNKIMREKIVLIFSLDKLVIILRNNAIIIR